MVVRDFTNQVKSQGIGSKMERKTVLSVGKHEKRVKKVKKLEEECNRGLTKYKERRRLAIQKGKENFTNFYKCEEKE